MFSSPKDIVRYDIMKLMKHMCIIGWQRVTCVKACIHIHHCAFFMFSMEMYNKETGTITESKGIITFLEEYSDEVCKET